MSTPISKENQEIIDRLAKKHSPVELVKNIDMPAFVSEYDHIMKKVDGLASASKSIAKAYQRTMKGGSKVDTSALASLLKAIEEYKTEMELIYNNAHIRIPDVINLKHAAEQEYLKELQRLNEAKANANLILDKIQSNYTFIEGEMRMELSAAIDLARRVKAAVDSGGMVLVGASPHDEVLFRVANLRK